MYIQPVINHSTSGGKDPDHTAPVGTSDLDLHCPGLFFRNFG